MTESDSDKPAGDKPKGDKKEERSRRNGPARLSAELPGLTKTAFRNTMGGRGFAVFCICWERIWRIGALLDVGGLWFFCHLGGYFERKCPNV